MQHVHPLEKGSSAAQGGHSDASFRFHDRSIFSILLQDAGDVRQQLALEYIGDACRVRA
jgi:hypothetical protein